MKRQLLAAVAMCLTLLLPAPALACVVVPPRTWSGSLQVAKPSQHVSSTAFIQNGCKWYDPALNGVDATVFDISTHRGLAGQATWDTSSLVAPDGLVGYFRTASCEHVADAVWAQPKKGEAVNFSFPSNAKWMIVQSATLTPSSGITIRITSPGRKCPAT